MPTNRPITRLDVLKAWVSAETPDESTPTLNDVVGMIDDLVAVAVRIEKMNYARARCVLCSAGDYPGDPEHFTGCPMAALLKEARKGDE